MRQVAHPDLHRIALDRILFALGDPVRLSIVEVLSDGKEHVQADFRAPVSASTLSYHMKILREAGIARSRPEGTRCFVTLRAEFEERFPGLLLTVLRLNARPTTTR